MNKYVKFYYSANNNLLKPIAVLYCLWLCSFAVYARSIEWLVSLPVDAGRAHTRVDCEGFKEVAGGCGQCFNGGHLYTDKSFQPFFNFNNRNKTKQVVIFSKDNKHIYTGKPLGNGVWYTSNNLLEWDSKFYTSKNKELYTFVEPGESSKLVKSKKGHGLQFQGEALDRNKPGYLFIFDLNYHYFDKESGKLGKKKTLRSCGFYYPAWCGDGVVDYSRGEACDPGDIKNKITWGASGCSEQCQQI